MIDLTRKPFHFLPLKNDPCFDLSCEFTISLIETIDLYYNELIEVSKKITEELPKVDFYLYKRSFFLIENIVDAYSKLSNSINISLGVPTKTMKNPIKIFDNFSYSPNKSLQTDVRLMRNSSQHFEERIQKFPTKVDPFLELFYKEENVSWHIKFGKGGHSHNGQKNNNTIFNIESMQFKSYIILDYKIISITIKVADIYKDTLEMLNLIEENMNQIINKKGFCCPPARNVSTFITLNNI